MEFGELSTVLIVLKKKIITLTVVLVLGFIGSFPFTGNVIEVIKTDILPEGASLIYLSPAEVMLLRVKMALIAGLLLMLPFIIYYVYSTIRTRFSYRFSLPNATILLILLFAVVLFLVGTGYAYFFMLPFFINYLYSSAASAGVIATYSVADFISFVTLTTVIFGLVFEFPLIIILMVHIGLVRRRTLVAYRPYVYVGLLFVAALITPPDVFSQILFAVPLILFYEISLLLLRIMRTE